MSIIMISDLGNDTEDNAIIYKSPIDISVLITIYKNIMNNKLSSFRVELLSDSLHLVKYWLTKMSINFTEKWGDLSAPSICVKKGFDVIKNIHLNIN